MGGAGVGICRQLRCKWWEGSCGSELEDGNGKTYLIYQSLDRKSWNRINTAEDIDSSRQVKKEFTYTGKAETYTVPYGGIYSLSLFGAQGGNYGSYAGGAGGSVTGRFYLYKGERLTVTVGGRDGYNGGGKASQYGTGGGMTSLVSDKKGTLLVAGGGGGATVLYDGYPGGSAAGLRPSGNAGQDGASGGGGGYRGGLSGELVYHVHSGIMTTGKTVIPPIPIRTLPPVIPTTITLSAGMPWSTTAVGAGTRIIM